MLKVFRRLPPGSVAAVMRDGFRDESGLHLADEPWTGVWVTDRPGQALAGAMAHRDVVVTIPARLFRRYERKPELGVRLALIPADVLNRYPRELVTG